MSKKETTRRYILFITGLFINAIGISLIIKAGLGSSPISSLPYTISLGFPVTLGTLTFIEPSSHSRTDCVTKKGF